MADIDIATTISDIKLFIEKLKNDLPEVFSSAASDSAVAMQSGKVLYQGNLLDADVRLNTEIQKNSAALEDGRLVIYIKSEKENISEIIETWLRLQAEQIIPVRAKDWAQKLGVEFNNIVIKDQKTMWGSCSAKRNLNFSYRVIKAPVIIMDYLIVHELAHLIHFNHGADYWATVAVHMPEYKEHRKWLNNNRYAVMAEPEVKYIAPKEEARNV